MTTANTLRQGSSLTKLILLMAVGASLLILSGCESLTDFEEVNTDPNNPQSATESLQLSALQTEFAYEVWANEPARTTSLWVRQLAQNTDPPNASTYQYSNVDPNNLWQFFLYTGTIKDAQRLKNQALENGNREFAGVAKIYEAWSWAVLTDLFDDAPYEEAFQANQNPTPAYSSQAVIYENVIGLLSSAIGDLDAGNEQAVSLADGDLVYGGSVEQWKKLANTLLAKYHIRLSEAGGDYNFAGGSRVDRAQNALAALEEGLASNADNAVFSFPGDGNAENPWYQFTIQGVWVTSQQMSEFHIKLLKNNEDPRLGIQARQVGAVDGQFAPGTPPSFQRVPFDPSTHFDTEDGTYVGHTNGADEGVADQTVSSIGTLFSSPDSPVFLQTYAELKLIEAEAHLIAGSDSEARSALEEGIRASLSQHGVTSLANVDQSFVDNFVSNRLTAFDDASGEEAKLEVIITEKYVANFLSYEPYNDWRRTGFPSGISRVANAEEPIIPQRLPYPNSELNNNLDNVPGKGTGTSALRTDVGWDAIDGDGIESAN